MKYLLSWRSLLAWTFLMTLALKGNLGPMRRHVLETPGDLVSQLCVTLNKSLNLYLVL